MKNVESLHQQALTDGRSHYLDPETGYQVCTRDFLASRGECCGSGCRHCPYVAQALNLEPIIDTLTG